jgi:DNA mismatch endonuclease (patch repair protein)
MNRLSPKQRQKFAVMRSELMRRTWTDPNYRAHMKQVHTGKKYPTASLKKRGRRPWNKGVLVQKTCQVCGKHFAVIPARTIPPRVAKYCSRRCTRLSHSLPKQDTSIERILQKELRKMRVRFITHPLILNTCRPDIVLSKRRIAVFCDGDYWHNRPDVHARDIKQETALRMNGWHVLRFWEREIKNNPATCAYRVVSTLSSLAN